MPSKLLDVLVWVFCLAASVHGDVQASVSQQSFDLVAGGSVTLSVHRGEGVCCSAWDWVGIYQNGVRLSYDHSGDGVNPGFNATLAVPPGNGTYTFAYSTSLDSWQVHGLGIALSFGESGAAPAIPMATLIPSYWYPTDPAWAQLQAAVQGSGLPAERVTVVLNPNNGNITHEGVPSAAAWASWRSRALNLSSAGLRVLAYVNLCSQVVDFQCVAAAHQGDKAFHGDHGVKAEIDMYVAELGAHLAGFFFDGAGHSGLHTGAILQATEYANSLGLSTVHNPGVLSQDPVLFSASNATVLREGSTPGDVNPFQAGLSAEKSVMVLHSVTGDAWRNSLDLARVRGFKYFYATESWAACPPYIGELLAAVAATAPNTTETPGTEALLPAPTCTLSHLLCPIPDRLAGHKYVIEGNESAAAGQTCGPPPETSDSVLFDIDIGQCNVTTISIAASIFELTVTLVQQRGILVFGDEAPPLVCKCQYVTSATASARSSLEGDNPADPGDPGVELTGNASVFAPALHLFPDASFAQPLLPGQELPLAASEEHFYIEVVSNDTHDNIGVPMCRAAPTDHVNDAHAVLLKEEYCGVPLFDVEHVGIPGGDNSTHRVRWRMRRFKFAGSSHVRLSCEVARCFAPPCGVCSRQPRRRQLRGLQESLLEVATMEFMLPPGGYMVLPGAVPEGAKHTVWRSAAARDTGDPAVWGNVTLYGFPSIKHGQQFADKFQELARSYMGPEVHVHQVWEVGAAAHADITIVGLYQASDSTLDHRNHTLEELTRSSTDFIAELLERVGEHGQHSNLMRMEITSAVFDEEQVDSAAAPVAPLARAPLAVLLAVVSMVAAAAARG